MSDLTKIEALYLVRDRHPGVSSEVQCVRIRAALSQFSITTFEAMRYLDVYDPRARVMQLRNQLARLLHHDTNAGQRNMLAFERRADRLRQGIRNCAGGDQTE